MRPAVLCPEIGRCHLYSSVQDGIYALGKANMRSTQSLGSFPNVASQTVPMFTWLTMALSRPFKEDRPALHLSLLSPLGDWWCSNLGFVAAGTVSGSSTLQTFRYWSHLCWLLFPPVYLLDHFSSFRHVEGSTTVEFTKLDVKYWHMPVWASNSTFQFCSKLIESVKMMACVARLSPLKAVQRRAWVTATTSIVKLEAETV